MKICKFKYRVWGFSSKGASLILFWTFVFTFEIVSIGQLSFLNIFNIYNKEPWTYGPILVASLSAPISGWFADAKFGNYRIVKMGSLVLFIVAVLNCMYHLIEPYIESAEVRITLQCLTLFVLIVGGSCLVSTFQLGLDQMPDASSSSITSFITWFTFSGAIGGFFGNLFHQISADCVNSSVSSNFICIWNLLVVFAVSCVLISDFFLSPKWLIVEPTSPKALKNIYQVLWFAANHKAPLNRSALTYWEENIPSRIDLGKSRYGRPFTTEQVEDVKTVLRMLLISLSTFLVNISLAYTAEISEVIIESCKFRLVNIFSYHELWIGLLWILFYELVIFPLIGSKLPSILKRIGAVCCCSIALNLLCLVLKIVSHLNQDIKAIDWINTIIYKSSLGVIYLTCITLMFEFVCAQSPYNMRSLLFGYFIIVTCFAFIFSRLLSHTIFVYGCTTNEWCLVVLPLSVKTFLSVMGLFLHCILARWYKKRERGDGYFAQKIVEEVYHRYLTPTT